MKITFDTGVKILDPIKATITKRIIQKESFWFWRKEAAEYYVEGQYVSFGPFETYMEAYNAAVASGHRLKYEPV